jgi:hypothetical protein
MTESPVSLLPVIKWLGLGSRSSVYVGYICSRRSLCSTTVRTNTIPPCRAVSINDAAGGSLNRHTLPAELEQVVILVTVCPCRLAFKYDSSSVLNGRQVESRVGGDSEVLDEDRRATADDGLDSRGIVSADGTCWVRRSGKPGDEISLSQISQDFPGARVTYGAPDLP